MDNLPLHRSILAVDMERSTSPLRTNPIKGDLRRLVYEMLGAAMAHAGVGPDRRDPLEDRGDGVLALIHPADDVPKSRLLSRLVPELGRLLLEYDLALPPEQWPSRGLRLRAVVHAGEVHRDAYGCFGEAVDTACRLLDAPQLKKCLRDAAGPLALVVSEEIYQGVVKHGYEGIPCGAYRQAVRVQVAGRRRLGWVHVPGEAVEVDEPRPAATVTPLRRVGAGHPAA
ncbi:hypothetical protein [Actinomadura macrotermitis]|uniref:Guanylate cyclase domain-containing protein n=1 Tax=Actinomadura macrotermitis TaxID=2585200 RepID=A0A7K0C2G3_9ACTN|nr:hypothetical protein [Actinomadura macrotermitis]MQY07566.1 hypothetical protein [Actinomadura macrotermitis]